MSLPAKWIDAIFTRLSTVYGHQFIGRWSGLDIGEVKADWARELGFYADKPKAIRYALEHLPPDSPPNVLQFRATCSRAPIDAPLSLPAPSADGLKRMAQAMSGHKVGGVTFAELLARHRQRRDEGRQSPAQRDWLRAVEALPICDESAPVAMDFRPIPDESLPPDMRAEQPKEPTCNA